MVTMSSNAGRNFVQGRSTYICSCCKRRTRETSVRGSDLCAECFELAGLQNMVWDGNFTASEGKERDGLLAKIGKLGGNIIAVKRSFKDLFEAKIGE